MKFASGRHTRAVCDRCGLEYKLNTLRKEWNNLKVCNSCWEPKHPQLELKGRSDAIAVRDPRPGQHYAEDNRVFIRTGVVSHGFIGEAAYIAVSDGAVLIGQEMTGELGDISLFIGTIISPSGVQTSGELGSAIAAISDLIAINGLQATSNTPTVGVSVNDSVMPAGLASATSLGAITLALDSNGWGLDTWGNGAWGN